MQRVTPAGRVAGLAREAASMRLNLRQQCVLAYIVAIGAVAVGAIALWPAQTAGIVAMAVATAMVGWVIGLWGTRRLHRHIAQVRRAAEAIGCGEFATRIECDERGAVTKLVQTLNSVAERMERLAEEERQLRHRLTHRERLAAIGELAATVAHEVNNPLDGVQNCARIVRRDPQNVAQTLRMLDLIDGGLSRIEILVRRLLTLARDEPLNPVPTRLDDVLDDALMFVQPRLDRSRIALVRKSAERPVIALVDRVQMAQAVMNLLVNAVDSTKPGGRITLELGEADRPGGPVRLVVEDNGEGIAPEHLTRVFEPFFSTKGCGGGTGLGLCIVRNIIEAHSGRIELASRLGEGTRFVISLPAAGTAPLLTVPHGIVGRRSETAVLQNQGG